MRAIPTIVALALMGCTRVPVDTSEMTQEELLEQSTHIFIGVVEKQELRSKLFFRLAGKHSDDWIVNRKVRVEMVVKGVEPRSTIEIYEVVSPYPRQKGDWNSTDNGQRYLFPVQRKGWRYRLTRDFWRSIYPIYSGKHDRLPLDATRPLWERFALLQWWDQGDTSRMFGNYRYTDPREIFGDWRRAKVLRGFLRHPDRNVRREACGDLVRMARGQDECWDSLDPSDQKALSDVPSVLVPNRSVRGAFENSARTDWERSVNARDLTLYDMDSLRLLTTINYPVLRKEFCAKFLARFPQNKDHGCPADRPAPATVVTENGDVPLLAR